MSRGVPLCLFLMLVPFGCDKVRPGSFSKARADLSRIKNEMYAREVLAQAQF